MAFAASLSSSQWKRLVAGAVLSVAVAVPAGANCVSFQERSGEPDRFVNNCGYTVVIKALFNNGYEGTWGPLNSGRWVSVLTGGDATRVSYEWCDLRDYHQDSCVPEPSWP